MGDCDGSEDGWSLQDICGEDTFIKFLKTTRSLLCTSCTPDARAVKNRDLDRLVKLYADKGIIRTPQQIRKTINNLRARVKIKIEKSRITNKPLKLSSLEKRFIDLLEADANSIVTKQEARCSVEVEAEYKGPQAQAEEIPDAAATLSPPPLSPTPSQWSTEFNRDAPSPALSSGSSYTRAQKRKYHSESRRKELEVQLKLADAQYLAAKQQRNYYEQQIGQLNVDRVQTPTGDQRNVVKAQLKAADMQMRAANMQMKAADAQHLAAEQQRIYYEHKVKRIRIDRLQTMVNSDEASPDPRIRIDRLQTMVNSDEASPDHVLGNVGTFTERTNGGNIFKRTSSFQSARVRKTTIHSEAGTSDNLTANDE